MGNLFILDVSKNLFLDIFRVILAFIDMLVYFLVEVLFRAVFNIANFELVGFYEIFEQRVYVILGIFMLFKVTISLITYLVNPDKISDKEQGAGKLITRIMTVLVMLIALPTFFNLMTELQNKLIPVIPRVVIGTANTLDNEEVSGVARNMTLTLLQGFAHKKEECTNVSELQTTWDLVKDINAECSADNNIYAYDYFPIISTLVGAIACYVVFSLCISVAIRAFKLIILRMIAPIPVISYIDPKSAKDGAFSHWTKTFLSTWAELFIHLGMIYFIVYVIDFLLSGDAWRGFFDGLTSTGPWAFFDGIILLAFLIIGLLFFAKSAPQFIFDALGIKNKGGFTRMLGMGATAIGTAGAARTSFRNRQDYDAQHGGNTRLRAFRNAGASLFTGLGAAIGGGNALLSSDKATWHTGMDQIQKSKALDTSRVDGNVTVGRRLLAGYQSLVGQQTRYDQLNNRANNYSAAEDAWKRLSQALNSDDEVVIFDGLGDNHDQGISIAAGTDREIIIPAGSRQYTSKTINDLLERMKNSGQYTANEIQQVEDAQKRIQSIRFNNIRNADRSNLHGASAQVYDNAQTIFNIGRQYSGEDDQVFAAFANVTSLDDANLTLSRDFKGASYSAGREASIIKASSEFKAEEAVRKQNGK